MKNKYIKLVLILTIIGTFTSCSDDFLEETTYGEVAPSEITKSENIEKAIIAVYSMLNGQIDGGSNAYNSPASNWSFGDVVSDDCYKGGGGTGDQNHIHLMEIFKTNPSLIDVERKWLALYEGVKRANEALTLLNNSEEFDTALKKQRTAELKFLRGHYYFELKKIYNNIPYIDENAQEVNDYIKSNTEYTSEEIWEKIEDDFLSAYNDLPLSQEEIGRPTKVAAKAYLVKCYLFQEKWQDVYTNIDEVLNSQYGLLDDFQSVFTADNDNSKEVIFAVQNSVFDGHPNNYNGSIGDRLSPPGGPYPQYGFHRPSQDLVNAFKTDANGLPLVDETDITENDYIDPRADVTIGRPGVPYKDLGIIYDESWARDLSTYGPFAPKKRILSINSPNYVSTWPYVNALNFYIIRYAEAILWKAEAAVELNHLEEARTLVNSIRERAANSNYIQNLEETADAANYKIAPYTSTWTNKETARDLVRLETRLEFALEGRRFFNLVRWNIADTVINKYLEVEKTKRTHLTNASFTKNKNEYFPIPQRYIDGSPDGLIKQNPNY